MSYFGLCLCFSLLVCYINSANILAVFHPPSKSHYNLAVNLLRPLAEKGHHVTIASPHTQKNPPKNWKEIRFTGYGKEIIQDPKMVYEYGDMWPFLKLIFFCYISREMTSEFFEHPAFQELINLKEQFDVIIIEKFANEAMIGLSHHFKAPYIWFNSVGYNHLINDLAGNPGSPAYLPDHLLDYTLNMNLWQRFWNSYFYCLDKILRYIYVMPAHQRLLEKYFPDAPKLEDLYYNSSLTLVNTHYSIKYAVPSVPNMIDIGGFHVTAPKNLSQDFQDFFDNAPNGVIYFSLGSVAQGKDMPETTRDSILRVFSKLKQKVLWKWEEKATFNIPPNVRLEKWLPQNDLLAHPNLKLFITHGGLLSTIEATYHGVPLLALPIFADQVVNAADTDEFGCGVQLPFGKFNEEKFEQLLTEVLSNPKYRNNMQTRSKLLKDQEMSPIDRAIFWIEYVIRHKGAPHLRSVTLNLKWYQYLLLDVLALAAVIVFSIYFVLKTCVSRVFRRKKKTVVNNYKKNN